MLNPRPRRPRPRTGPGRRRTGVLLAAALPLVVGAAAVALKAGRWELHATRRRIEITARPRPDCPDCRGHGDHWTNGAHPEREACGCWASRRSLHIRLLPVPAYDEPPF